MRAFVRLREMIGTHADLARRLDELERRFREHDDQFVVVFDAIRQLMVPPQTPPPELGYHTLSDNVAQVVLLSSGFHRHHRGRLRKRREDASRKEKSERNR